jgi:hypothetical protein
VRVCWAFCVRGGGEALEPAVDMVVVDYGRLATAESWRTLALIRAGIPPRHLNSRDAVPACNARNVCAAVTPTGRWTCKTARNSAICYRRLLADGTEACKCSGAGHERGGVGYCGMACPLLQSSS